MSLASRKLIQATAGATTVDTGDDDFANVVLLLDGDGTSGDNNETFTDSSTNGFTVTETGSVVQGSFSPYGDNWSNNFNSSDERLDFTPSFSLGSNDFTIEMWVNPSAASAGSLESFFWLESGGSDFLVFRINNSNNEGLEFRVYNGNNKVFLTQGSDYLENGEWVHVAATKSGSTYNFFVNGTSLGTATYATALTSYSNGHIGAWTSVSQDYAGYISNVRVINGTALYTSNFTPPTSYLTAVTNTVLLTCQSNRFVDNSSSPHTLTVGVTPKVTPFSPFKNDDARDITTDGGSAYFDGSSYLSTPNDTAYRPNTGAYTVEGWFYTTKSTTQVLFDARQTGNTDQRVTFWVEGGDELRFWHGVGSASTSNVFNTGEWVYIAASRGSGTTEIYVNGTRINSFSDSTQLYNFRPYYGARWDAGAKLDEGYLADWRITVGEKLYTGTTMTVPTAPIGLHSSTDSYLAFQDAAIYDRSGINNLDTVGNAQIDTAVVKYDTGSMQFDGSGDDLRINVTDPISFSGYAGDFTTEMWVYPTAVGQSSNSYVWQHASSSTAYSPFIIVQRPSTYEFAIYASSNGSSWNLISNATIGTATANTWHHIAVVRDGTNIKAYMNGTVGSTSAVSTTAFMTTSGQICIGSALGFSNSYFTGFIDDLRITKGVARYTADFTPPTDALPKF